MRARAVAVASHANAMRSANDGHDRRDASAARHRCSVRATLGAPARVRVAERAEPCSRVLVVDDEATPRVARERAPSSRASRSRRRRDGERGPARRSTTSDVDLALVDLMMPRHRTASSSRARSRARYPERARRADERLPPQRAAARARRLRRQSASSRSPTTLARARRGVRPRQARKPSSSRRRLDVPTTRLVDRDCVVRRRALRLRRCRPS